MRNGQVPLDLHQLRWFREDSRPHQYVMSPMWAVNCAMLHYRMCVSSGSPCGRRFKGVLPPRCTRDCARRHAVNIAMKPILCETADCDSMMLIGRCFTLPVHFRQDDQLQDELHCRIKQLITIKLPRRFVFHNDHAQHEMRSVVQIGTMD